MIIQNSPIVSSVIFFNFYLYIDEARVVPPPLHVEEPGDNTTNQADVQSNSGTDSGSSSSGGNR